jgi:hypothetical protein
MSKVGVGDGPGVAVAGIVGVGVNVCPKTTAGSNATQNAKTTKKTRLAPINKPNDHTRRREDNQNS